MRITHLCLAGTVSDGYSYQENLLLKYHLRMGHDVSLISSRWEYDTNYNLYKSDECDYYYEGIHVIRLDISNRDDLRNKFKRYKGVTDSLQSLNPEILFIHGCQFLDINEVAAYLNNHKRVIAYLDNHADFSNSGRNFVSRYILHKIIWRSCLKRIAPFVNKFYGVLPARVSFLKDIYGAPADRCELLVMGGDDDYVNSSIANREHTREKYGIKESQFLIVTGGKIDKAKAQTILLMEAVTRIHNVSLIMFGPIDDSLKSEADSFVDGLKIISLGWASAQATYDLFAASDMVIFPGRHSVYWEQAASVGAPMIVKFWPGTDHVNCGGNVLFLYEDSVDEIESKIRDVMGDTRKYKNMLSCAKEHMKSFLYSEIAKKSIQ